MKEKSENRGAILHVAAVIVVILFLAVSFLTFTRDNNARIIEQNNSFIKTAATQTADRMNDIISASERNAALIAHLYEPVMTSPEVDAELLRDMISNSTFDYVEFISADGIDLTADGQTADLSDREYFQLGMQGKSGRCIVRNSRITNETLLIFYEPFHYDGEIIGVLSCILRGDTIEGMLTADYFGIRGSTYLVERNGDIIVSIGGTDAGNLLDFFSENDVLSPEDMRKFEDALDDKNDIDFNSFNYRGKSGAGSAYITALEGGDWVVVQSFPSSVTDMMTRDANSAGIRLEVNLILVFVLYLVYIIVKNRRQKRVLVSEKQEMSGIVDAVTGLFTRFALVDFENDTYEYLEDKKGGAPESGKYSDLIAFLDTKYIDEKDSEKMSVVIGPEYVREHLTEDVPYLRFEYEIDMNGRRWENISILCLHRRDGVPVNVLYAIQDVTALKEREQEIRLALKNTSEAAEAANRAKSDFLARMSHDIRTPMNAIMGMTAVAAMHLDDKERLTDCLGKITISSRHLLALINDVLDMSKIESGKVSLSEEPFNMADMVESIVTIIKSQVSSKNQELRVHINDIVHEDVIGDTLRLRQIFVNILGNAVKFTPEGGTITFTIRECPSHSYGTASFEFVCEDTGMGMDEDFVKTIFDPFSRSKQSISQKIEGTGLGMSITQNIIRMMNGDISVESKLGVGSKFTVQLPLALQNSDTADIEELCDLHVLVADDDRDCCVTACEILESIKMNPEWVLSGEEAVERTVAAHESGSDFAAVILDWKMPGMDGVETARKIREHIGDGVPIIILSAYDWTDVETEARNAGIQAFIEKPLFRSRLIFALKSVLSGDASENLPTGPAEEGKYSGKHILLVEDNELNMEIAKELLSVTDAVIDDAPNGKVAVDMVSDSPLGYYDLIFMDIQMPVMDGYDAARGIRALDRSDASEIPIIAMTANAFSDDIWQAHAAGMNDHIAKPVEVAKLMEMLDKWIKK